MLEEDRQSFYFCIRFKMFTVQQLFLNDLQSYLGLGMDCNEQYRQFKYNNIVSLSVFIQDVTVFPCGWCYVTSHFNAL